MDCLLNALDRFHASSWQTADRQSLQRAGLAKRLDEWAVCRIWAEQTVLLLCCIIHSLKVSWEQRENVKWKNGNRFWRNRKHNILADPFGRSHYLQPIASSSKVRFLWFCSMKKQVEGNFFFLWNLSITILHPQILSLHKKCRQRRSSFSQCDVTRWFANFPFGAYGLESLSTASWVSRLVLKPEDSIFGCVCGTGGV